jgi:glucosamine 6-phosphate synthetase-like amidotransferase/phosphosugar isomerase protein
MSEVTWQELLGIDVITYRRFIDDLTFEQPETAILHLIRVGAVLALRDGQTIALPSDLTPLQLELLTAVYLIGLAVRLARNRGKDTELWETGLAQLPLLIARLAHDPELMRQVEETMAPFVSAGYDKVQIIGGGQDHIGAASIARSFRLQGFMSEELYTDSAWHGPLAAVGGPDAEHDTLVIILATDPLFQAAALVDTQVYRARQANVILVVPQGNEELSSVRGVDASSVLAVTPVPRPFLPVIHAALGDVLARQMAQLWDERGGR